MGELLAGKSGLRKVPLKIRSSPGRKRLQAPTFTPLKSTAGSVARSPGGTPLRPALTTKSLNHD